MSKESLHPRPDLEQYKKQAKELLRDARAGARVAVERFQRSHPSPNQGSLSLADAQLVIAREHGCASWAKFCEHVRSQRVADLSEDADDLMTAFFIAATAPRDAHDSGTLEEAEQILSQHPSIRDTNIYTAAVLANEDAVRGFLEQDQSLATKVGGPLQWDALTCLCFSRYLRLDKSRSKAFVRTARLLLEAGANANTGWYETIDHPRPRQIRETAIYGAAGVAKHAELTRLLLEYGADPNDEETPYHVPESYDNSVMQVLLESGKLDERSKTWMLVRKCDWHDEKGLLLALQHGADPNGVTRWGMNAFYQSVQRNNGLEMVSMLIDAGANPLIVNTRDGLSGAQLAARRGRGDVLRLLAQRWIDPGFDGVDRLIAACALGDRVQVDALATDQPTLVTELLLLGGSLLAIFAGVGNAEGIRCLLALGVPATSTYHGDNYFDVAQNSTALHYASWLNWPRAMKILLERGAPVNALDGKGRTALQLAIRACTDSYWKHRRTVEGIAALLEAGANADGISFPTGYPEADALIMRYASRT